jgi:hypothetical protein
MSVVTSTHDVDLSLSLSDNADHRRYNKSMASSCLQLHRLGESCRGGGV